MKLMEQIHEACLTKDAAILQRLQVLVLCYVPGIPEFTLWTVYINRGAPVSAKSNGRPQLPRFRTPKESRIAYRSYSVNCFATP
jgi:hypothetical protein